MKVLIISSMPTHPPIAGNRACILAYSELLISLGYDVSFLWVSSPNPSQEEVQGMNSFWGAKLIHYKRTRFQLFKEKLYRNLRFKRTGFYKVDDLFPNDLITFLKTHFQENQVDCVVVNYIFFSRAFDAFPEKVRKVLYTHDVFTDRYQKTGNPWFSTTPDEEAKALNRADVIWAIQENEASYYHYLSRSEVLTTYSFFQITETRLTEKKVLLFFSGSNQHNVEAIIFFIETIFPKLQQRFPDVKLLVGGTICDKISERAGNGIELLGAVEDPVSFYSLGDICINPTFSGTGLKIKTFEAMAHGKIVICHPHNIEGVYNGNAAPVFLAEDANGYLAALQHLFEDREVLLQRRKAALEYITQLNDIVKDRIQSSIEKPNRMR
ncbi:glycosyltransferase [Filimonas effusa]|uniref:Glycosyltransferase n=1 Tax=Filimonas effusa TaxID=2508721 RepID=A0A4Q1DFC8_9BACT|nr:glycosyltransferase [Filimonas effusa]RXK87349.1 glycosyltransferase [Filimonas effusa]